MKAEAYSFKQQAIRIANLSGKPTVIKNNDPQVIKKIVRATCSISTSGIFNTFNRHHFS